MSAVDRSALSRAAGCRRGPFARGLIVAAGCAALQSGCGAWFAAAPPDPIPTARHAIDQMRAQHACSRGLSGESVLDSFDDDQGRIRVKTLFLASHPENVRFDLMSPLGSVLATLTADGQDFALLDLRKKEFFVGPAGQCNVERFLKVPIPPAALVQLLAGEAPVLIHEPTQARLSWEGGAYVVQIDSLHQATQSIALEPTESTKQLPWAEQQLQVTEVVVSQGGVELYRVELDDYRPVVNAAPRVDPDGLSPDILPSGPQCHAHVPHKVRFVVPIAGRDVLFEHSELRHNPPLLQGSFEQLPPRGVRMQYTPCADAAPPPEQPPPAVTPPSAPRAQLP